MRTLTVYVLIDLEKLGKSSETPQTFGSLKELVSANIQDKGETLTYAGLWNRLSKNSEIHYWKNSRFLVKKCVVQRSKKSTVKK